MCDKKYLSEILWKIFLMSSIILAVIPMVLCATGNVLSADPSYYLSIVERISEGKTLYGDIRCGYTPLWFYLMLGWKSLFSIPSGSEEMYYVLHFLMQLGAAFFLYKIIRRMDVDSKIAYFCAWLFVMMGHSMEGNFLILEVSSVMFGLLAVWLVMAQKNRTMSILFAGIATACSFLCKQYGLGYFFLCIFLLWFGSKNGRGKIFVFVLGFLLPVLLCLLIWRQDFVSNILLNGYGTSVDEARGVKFSDKMGWIIGSGKYLFFRSAIVLLPTLLFIPLLVKEKKAMWIIFSWCGLFGFLMANYFVFGLPRYLLLTLPFAMMLIALTLSVLPKSGKLLCIVFVLSLLHTTLYSVGVTYYKRVWEVYLHQEQKELRERIADDVKKHIRPNATLWTPNCALCFVYYLSNSTPPNLATIGYAFGSGMTRDMAMEQAKSADYVLCFDMEKAEHYFTPELTSFIRSHEAIYVDTTNIIGYLGQTGNIVLYDMSKMKSE